MTFSEFTKKLIEKEIQPLIDRVPESVRDKVQNKYEIKGNKVTLFECRANWEEPDNPDLWSKNPIAQFRFENNLWSLYWLRANGKWLLCAWVGPQKHLAKLVESVEEDANGTFWG